MHEDVLKIQDVSRIYSTDGLKVNALRSVSLSIKVRECNAGRQAH
jgi:hypothetical protein